MKMWYIKSRFVRFSTVKFREGGRMDETTRRVEERCRLWILRREREQSLEQLRLKSELRAPSCPICRTTMVRTGSYYECLACGSTFGICVVE